MCFKTVIRPTNYPVKGVRQVDKFTDADFIFPDIWNIKIKP